MLGYLYEDGKGTEKNLEKAIYWYNKAAENGNKLAQYNFGRIYRLRKIIKKKEKRHLNIIKNLLKRNILMHNYNLVIFMRMVRNRKGFRKSHLLV